MNYISDRRNSQISVENEQLFQQITEYEQIETELNKSLSLLQATLESTPSGIIAFNYQDAKFSCQQEIVSVNQKFWEMWQVPDAIIRSLNPKQILAFCSNQLKDATVLTRCIQKLHNQLDIELYSSLELQDGRIFQQHSQPLRLCKKIIGRTWSFLDVTEHQRVQNELLSTISTQQRKHHTLQQVSAAESPYIPKLIAVNTEALSTNSKSIFPSVPQLREVFDFIEANYHQPITLSDVAQAVGYSPAYLTDLVRRQTGQTVNRWIVERRIKAACSLLVDTEQSVEQIATAVGYQNLGHFFRQFRQYQGQTPCSWRRAHQA